MTRHLAVCEARPVIGTAAGLVPTGKKASVKFYDLLVEGADAPMYWMHLEMPVTATLADLDVFLRNQWLECCGHLSAFRIGDESYDSVMHNAWKFEDEPDDLWGLDENPMDKAKLAEVIKVGDEFSHEYDFGTTTELKLKVVAEVEKAPSQRKVEVLARNAAPDIRCDNCGGVATEICTECVDEEGGWLCDKCAKKHNKRHEDMFLPVVNSPRMGMCAYGT